MDEWLSNHPDAKMVKRTVNDGSPYAHVRFISKTEDVSCQLGMVLCTQSYYARKLTQALEEASEHGVDINKILNEFCIKDIIE